MKHAICQMDIIAGNPEKNREKVAMWMEKVMEDKDIDIVVLPEMWTTAYTLDQLEVIADKQMEPTLSFVKELAKRYQVNIVAGSIANNRGGKIYNTAFVVNREGELVHEYDKLHLVPMLNEPDYLTGGEEKVSYFELEGVRMGIIICYDLRFPELARRLALQGTDVLYVVAEWPKSRSDHWRALQIARAIENQFFVISANRIGNHDGVTFAGKSMIINPWGEVTREGSMDTEETLIETLDMEMTRTTRKKVPIFSSRVPNKY